MIANIKMKENNGVLSLEEIHRIVDAVSVNLDTFSPDYTQMPTMPQMPAPSRTSTPKAPPPRDQSDVLYFHGTKTITFGKHKGHPFWYAWQDENYVEWVLQEVNEGSSRGMKERQLRANHGHRHGHHRGHLHLTMDLLRPTWPMMMMMMMMMMMNKDYTIQDTMTYQDNLMNHKSLPLARNPGFRMQPDVSW